MLDAAVLICTAAVWGGMLFFAGLFAPLVFMKLPADEAGGFIRALFPVYYLVFGSVSLLTGLLMAISGGKTVASTVMLLVGAGFLLARWVLMPRINRFRDASLAGDAAAGASFRTWHRASVSLNLLQMILVLGVLVELRTG